MQERRRNPRNKVMYGGLAETDGASRECVVRNISDTGASIEFSNDIRLPREQLLLKIARKGRAFAARIVWWRDNFVGLAFNPEPSVSYPRSDLEERLRRSEKKKRELQQRIRQLIDGG